MRYAITTSLVFALMLGGGCSRADAGEQSPDTRRLPHYNSPEFTPRWNVATDDASFHKIRSFKLWNQHGKVFTEADLRGKISVVDFFFTQCVTLCPRMTAAMLTLQDTFRHDDDIVLLSHSVTPNTDTVEVLQRYAAVHDIDFRRWKLLTGSRDEIYDLGRNYYFVEEDLGVDKDPDDFLHTENFVLVDEHLHIRGIYNSQDPRSMKALVADIKALKNNG